MITEWFISLAVGFLQWATGLLGTAAPPQFISDAAGAVTGIVNSAAGLGAWIPWAYLGVVGGGVLTYWLVVVGVKAVRWVWGLTPFSGGS